MLGPKPSALPLGDGPLCFYILPLFSKTVKRDIISPMIFTSESSLSAFAERLGAFLKTQKLPLCLELVGDVGAGKTTFTRALAKGLGITAPVTSPSFTISKEYPFDNNFLVHYDFYRLQDPGLMSEDLNESLNDPSVLTVVEWADSVQNLLPKNRLKITFKIQADNSRKLIFNQPMEKLYGTLS